MKVKWSKTVWILMVVNLSEVNEYQMNCTPAGNSVCPYIHTHRALATHSSVASLTPATTVVFRGGITITGGTGSAGASESKQEKRWWEKEKRDL